MATRKLELLVDLQSINYSPVTATNNSDQIAKTERIVEILAALSAWLKENDHEKADDFIKESDTFVECVRAFADLSIKLHHAHTVGNRGPGQNPAAPNVAPAEAGAVTKPDQELRPPKLHNDTTMGKLREWNYPFTSYYNSSSLSRWHISSNRDPCCPLWTKTFLIISVELLPVSYTHLTLPTIYSV